VIKTLKGGRGHAFELIGLETTAFEDPVRNTINWQRWEFLLFCDTEIQ
jgi:hypothetical protein